MIRAQLSLQSTAQTPAGASGGVAVPGLTLNPGAAFAKAHGAILNSDQRSQPQPAVRPDILCEPTKYAPMVTLKFPPDLGQR
ncbi:hypothetical protein, partial [Streptomyces ipomoeae]|uniref:hypothetical protein n=1 Tax=Streptomyces ipomoeae TaxID=103232 RepID=UPI001C6810A9